MHSPLQTATVPPGPDRNPDARAQPANGVATRRWPAIAATIVVWGLAGAGLWLGARWACPTSECGPTAWDKKILDVLALHGNPALDTFLAAATWLGSIAVLLPASLFLAWRYRHGTTPGGALLLPLAVSGAWLLAHCMKLLIARPRPELHSTLIAMPADLSYPSAHSMQAAAFATAWLLTTAHRPSGRLVVFLGMMVVLVAWSRLHLQVHFPTDVLAGLIAGMAWAAGLRATLGVRW